MAALPALSDRAVLSSWEEGSTADDSGRPARVLAHAVGCPVAEVEAWPLGRRDSAFLDVHETSFGSALAGLATCPECGEELEVALDVAEVRAPHGSADEEHELELDDCRIAFRLPTSADVVAVFRERRARTALAERCLVRSERAGRPVAAPDLPGGWVDAVSAAMAECDPQAQLELAMTCPACGHGWKLTLDVGEFVWRQVERRARELLDDIAVLAAAFAWSEDEILALSEPRRRRYLELVEA